MAWKHRNIWRGSLRHSKASKKTLTWSWQLLKSLKSCKLGKIEPLRRFSVHCQIETTTIYKMKISLLSLWKFYLCMDNIENWSAVSREDALRKGTSKVMLLVEFDWRKMNILADHWSIFSNVCLFILQFEHRAISQCISWGNFSLLEPPRW